VASERTARTQQTTWGGLTLRPLIIALALSLCTGLMAIVVPKADAVVCPPPSGYKSIGGTCYKVKGVRIDAQVNHAGRIQRNPKFFSGIIDTQGQPGILFCGNRGGNQPPGQRLVVTDVPLTCSTQITPQDVISTNDGGTANVTCTALLPFDELQALGEANCTPGQEALDYVPCSFLSDVTYSDGTIAEPGDVIETARHSCTLPLCTTLGWNKSTDLPEARDYECTGPIDVP
jgi:hypothetical protein